MHQITPHNTFTTITADVKNLGLSPKLMVVLSEILALSKNDKGVCFASNKHFAKLISRSKSTASRTIKELRTLGLLSSKLIYKIGSKQVLRRDVTAVLHNKETYNAKKSKDDKLLDKKIIKIFEAYPTRAGESKPSQITPIARDAINNGIKDLAFLHCINKVKAAEKLFFIVQEFAKITALWSDEQRKFQYGIVSFMDKQEFNNEFKNWRRFIQKKETNTVIPQNNYYANQILRDKELQIKKEAAELDNIMLKKRYSKATSYEKEIIEDYIAYLKKELKIAVNSKDYYIYLDPALKWHKKQ